MSKITLKVVAIIFTVLCALCILLVILNSIVFPMATLDNTVVATFTVEKVDKVGSAFTYIVTKERPNRALIVRNDRALNLEALDNLSQGDIIIARLYAHVIDNEYYGDTECFGLHANGKTVVSFEDVLKEDKRRFVNITLACVFWIVVFAVISTVCFCMYRGVLTGHKNDSVKHTR